MLLVLVCDIRKGTPPPAPDWRRPPANNMASSHNDTDLSAETVFIARQHTDTRYWYNKFLCLSVRDVPVLYENGLTYCHRFFTIQ